MLPLCISCPQLGDDRHPASATDRDLRPNIRSQGQEARVYYEITKVVTISDGFVETRFAYPG